VLLFSVRSKLIRGVYIRRGEEGAVSESSGDSRNSLLIGGTYFRICDLIIKISRAFTRTVEIAEELDAPWEGQES
jgi:hypothetical protein